MRLSIPAVALTFLAAITPAAAAQHPLVELPLTDPAYVQLDGLMRQGCATARVSQFRPFLIGDVRKALREASADRACAGRVLDALTARFVDDSAIARDSVRNVRVGGAVELRGTALKNGEFRPLWNDVRPTSEGDDPAVGIARVRLTWNGGPHVVAVSEAFAQTGVRNDPLNREETFRRTSGVIGFDDAYLTGQLGKLVVSLGRTREAWLGEGSESMVLSANGPAYDRLLFAFRFSKFEFRSLAALINDVTLVSGTDSLPDGVARQQWHRYLVAHGLTFRPARTVELTIGETALVPRQGFSVDLNYLNPVMVYQITQHDAGESSGGGDANLTGFFAVRATAGRATFSGEFLLDDYQIDSKDKQVYPNQLGWNAYASYALPLPVPTTLGVQYRRDDAFTYIGQKSYAKVYQNFGEPLGSELGPDADMLRGYGEVWATGKLRLVGGISRWRHGAYRLDDRPAVYRQGHAGEPFPDTTAARPAVQKAWLADASAEWLDAFLPITARVELARIENVNNVPSPATNYARLQLLASYRFRYP